MQLSFFFFSNAVSASAKDLMHRLFNRRFLRIRSPFLLQRANALLALLFRCTGRCIVADKIDHKLCRIVMGRAFHLGVAGEVLKSVAGWTVVTYVAA
jgi:hypothetical protein